MKFAKHRSVVAGTIIAALALSAGGISPVMAANETEEQSSIIQAAATTPDGEISEEQFLQTIEVLDQLPEDLKNADPKTTPNYEQRLTEAINEIEGHGAAAPGGAVVLVNWASCALALAQIVAEYGIPVAKVVKWLKDGYKIFGGIKGLISAIRSGAAISEVGEEAATVLGGILGVDSVVAACS